MLKQRIVTGILYGVVVLASIFYLPPVGFLIFSAFLCIGCYVEWMALAAVPTRIHRGMWVALFLFGLALVYCSSMVQWVSLFVALLLWAGIMAWLVACQVRGRISVLSPAGMMVLACLTLWALFSGLLTLRALPDGPLWVLLTFIVVWSSDTFAYLVGRALGAKHKLAPVLSPGKSIEGLVGGMVFTIPVVILYFEFVLHRAYPVGVIVMVMMWVLIALAGDLFESALKRIRGVKDSGTILPGHGGLLDRLDSLIALTPCLALGLIKVLA